MDSTFDVDEFIARVGQRLVAEIVDAKAGTTPATVGAAVETPIRQKLEQLLPAGIGVGSGFIIDSYGGTSRQMDVVLFEKELCPKFSINDSPETTYYPCEGVIAAGEVKSTLNNNTLRDSLKKVSSVKQLRRHVVHDPIPHPETGAQIPIYRHYGTPSSGDVRVISAADQNDLHDIFCFVVAGSTQMRADTVFTTIRKHTELDGEACSVGLLAILDSGIVEWANLGGMRDEIVQNERSGRFSLRRTYTEGDVLSPAWSAVKADYLAYKEDPQAFRTLCPVDSVEVPSRQDERHSRTRQIL